jgi:predicted secreted protein
MKRIKSILGALATLRRIPSATISEAWSRVKAQALLDDDDARSIERDADLIDSLISAVIAIAKDDEDKAAVPGKADKSAA